MQGLFAKNTFSPAAHHDFRDCRGLPTIALHRNFGGDLCSWFLNDVWSCGILWTHFSKEQGRLVGWSLPWDGKETRHTVGAVQQAMLFWPGWLHKVMWWKHIFISCTISELEKSEVRTVVINSIIDWYSINRMSINDILPINLEMLCRKSKESISATWAVSLGSISLNAAPVYYSDMSIKTGSFLFLCMGIDGILWDKLTWQGSLKRGPLYPIDR